MHVSLEGTCDSQVLAIDGEVGVCAQGLEINPIAAGMRNCERASPGNHGVGGQSIAILHGEVELGIGLLSA
jgi:hypothetical protein